MLEIGRFRLLLCERPKTSDTVRCGVFEQYLQAQLERVFVGSVSSQMAWGMNSAGDRNRATYSEPAQKRVNRNNTLLYGRTHQRDRDHGEGQLEALYCGRTSDTQLAMTVLYRFCPLLIRNVQHVETSSASEKRTGVVQPLRHLRAYLTAPMHGYTFV